ncbi:hypothetical protein OH77DRAFT_1285783 [Trametes cingulata]|nr:hypothetical protein OH77DRAFT_1285783 [Trametes cingulata]
MYISHRSKRIYIPLLEGSFSPADTSVAIIIGFSVAVGACLSLHKYCILDGTDSVPTCLSERNPESYPNRRQARADRSARPRPTRAACRQGMRELPPEALSTGASGDVRLKHRRNPHLAKTPAMPQALYRRHSGWDTRDGKAHSRGCLPVCRPRPKRTRTRASGCRQEAGGAQNPLVLPEEAPERLW